MAIVLNASADFIVGITNNHLPTKSDKTSESTAIRDMNILMKFRKLSDKDKIRIEERIDILLENNL